MISLKYYFNLSLILLLMVSVNAKRDQQNVTIEHTCHLLDDKFAVSSPWAVYPIVYEPINRGRLTIWTGICTLPTSEFRCYKADDGSSVSVKNATSNIVLNFASFANEIGWTFYDMNKGATYHGVSVNFYEDIKYKVSLTNKQDDSYLECNTIDKIEQFHSKDKALSIQTACPECSQSLISLINGQIRELIKTRLDEQIIDNLYWQLSQLLFNMHFTGPVSLVEGNSD